LPERISQTQGYHGSSSQASIDKLNYTYYRCVRYLSQGGLMLIDLMDLVLVVAEKEAAKRTEN